MKRQGALVELANFVEYFESDAISAIEAQTDIEGIETTLAALSEQADAAIQQLLS